MDSRYTGTRRVFYIPPVLSMSSFFNGIDGIVYRNNDEINNLLRERLQGVDSCIQNQILSILLHRNRYS